MTSLARHVRSVVDRDGTVILDIEHGEILTFNPTGGYIWDRLQQGKLVNDIVCELAAETGADVEAVDRDVRAFLEQLVSKHLFVG